MTPKLSLIALVIIGLACSCSTSKAQDIGSELTKEQMREDLDQAVSVTKRAWAYTEYKKANFGVDLDDIHKMLIEKTDQASTTADFVEILQRFVACLKDGHSWLTVPENRAASQQRQWPFRVREVQEGIAVSEADANSGINVGDLLLEVDAVPVQQLIDARMLRTSASSDVGRRYNAIKSLIRTPKGVLACKFQRPDGTIVDVTVQTKTPTAQNSDEATIEHRSIDDKIGYVRVASLTQDYEIWSNGGKTPAALQRALAAKKTGIREAFENLKDSKAIILDLRDNGGGSDALGHYLAQFVVDADKFPNYYSLQTQISEDLLRLPDFQYLKSAKAGTTIAPTPTAIMREKDIRPYKGELIVLINEGCFSATDNFISYLANCRPEARFVGRPNHGGSGAPRKIVTLKNSNVALTFCVMRVWDVNNHMIEGNPIHPHIQVKWTRNDLIEKADPDLTAAIQEAHRLLN
jgi:carboxyl-terminal processing protease